MDYAVYIPLKAGPYLTGLLLDHAAARICGKHGAGHAEDPLSLFASLSRGRHFARLLFFSKRLISLYDYILITDKIGEVQEGYCPLATEVNEENIEKVYDAYIVFATQLHEDAVAEYETKLNTYQVPSPTRCQERGVAGYLCHDTNER